MYLHACFAPSDFLTMTDAWTTVGKGGKPVSFPPEAMAAFGSRDRSSRHGSRFAGERGRSEFPAEAASAFSSRPSGRAPYGGDGTGFDGESSAFRTRRPHSGPDAFDATAAAAFGNKSRRADFPDAFAGRPARHYTPSVAAPPPPAPAPKPKQTFEEMFPALGTPAPKPATAVAAPKTSFADLMRRHAEKDAHDTAEAERRAALAREAYEKEEKERALLRRLHRARTGGGAYTSNKYSADAEEDDEGYGEEDLEHDGYGSVRAEARPAPSYSHMIPDEEPETTGEWETA